jgi:hypothetical protein
MNSDTQMQNTTVVRRKAWWQNSLPRHMGPHSILDMSELKSLSPIVKSKLLDHEIAHAHPADDCCMFGYRCDGVVREFLEMRQETLRWDFDQGKVP